MIYLLFLIAVACSIMSQHPLITGTSIASLLNYSWCAPLLYSFLSGAGRTSWHPLVKSYVTFSIVITLYVTLLVPSATASFTLDMDVYYILISLSVVITSYIFWYNHSSSKFLSALCFVLMITVPVVAYSIYTGFIVVTSLDSLEYAYEDKNSIATIILSTVIISFFNFNTNHKYLKWLSWGLMALLVVMLFLLKSRASLIGFFFVLFWIVLKSDSKKYKAYVFIGLAIFSIVVLTQADAYTVIVDNIFLGNRKGGDLNDLSSGRMNQIERGLSVFLEYPILGKGKFYVDCFPVAMLSSFGIIGFFIIYHFIVSIGRKIVHLDKSNNIFLSTFFLYLIFILNSFFEAHAPFGPGVKCFLFWMMYGFTSAELMKSNVNYIIYD